MTSFVKQLFPLADIVGVDPSAKSIECAQELSKNITFAETDGCTLNYPDSTFDIVYAAGVFHHIPFEDHHNHLKQLFRVLKPGGRFVMFELNPINPLTVLTFKRNPIDQNAKVMTPWYSNSLLKSYGTHKIKFYCFFPSFLAKLRRLEPYMTKVPFGALYATISVKSLVLN
jgi:ubiquinone/menaquinone biosynthesis C-methylase UbiE